MVREKKKNFEIMTIANKYKDILNDFINNSDQKSLQELIDERSRNAPRSRGGSTGLLEKHCLNEDVLASDTLS